MLINNHPAQSWDIPEEEIGITESWDLKSKHDFRKEIIDRWLDAMRSAYRDLIERMGEKVSFQITLGSRVNIAEISDEKMEEFELSITKKYNHAHRTHLQYNDNDPDQP